MNNYPKETIVALSTAATSSAIAVVRMSGNKAIKIIRELVFPKIDDPKPNQIYFGYIKNNGKTIDQVLVSVFLAPKSYTGEDMIEISCHGSAYIVEQIITCLMQKGARYAKPGEFTHRAFLNGKMDLTQAEAVADIVSSTNEQSHRIAISQLRGGVSMKLKALRENLINFSSLIELELDFSQEDVEFADRTELNELATIVKDEINLLMESFKYGNALKNGVPVAIIGKPNSGKSTLLNVLLNEEKAIVSEIPGTTRDSIEDSVNIDGVSFRFIDTAGIRNTENAIELMGIERSYKKASEARIVILLVDPDDCLAETAKQIRDLKEQTNFTQEIILVVNKSDLHKVEHLQLKYDQAIDSLGVHVICYISAKQRVNIDNLTRTILNIVKPATINTYDTVISNVRHLSALQKANDSVERVIQGLKNNIPEDFLAQDIRETLHHLGEITGDVSTDDILGKVFSSFCIGK